MTDFITALKAHAPRIQTGAMSGLDFGPIHSLNAVKYMAIKSNCEVEDIERGVLVTHKDVEGAFCLYKDTDGHIKLDAADADDVHGES